MQPNVFDIRKVRDLMKLCLDDNYDVQAYIDMYAEIHKMFANFGRGFSFVTSELDEKSNILIKRLETDSQNCSKMEEMMNFELENDLVTVKAKVKVKYNSGTRALSRLNRALEFVLEIFAKFAKSTTNTVMSAIVRSAYDDTMAKFHTWLTRQAVHLGSYLLPSRNRILADFTKPNLTQQELFVVLEETITIGRQLYNGIQKMFAAKNMLNLR